MPAHHNSWACSVSLCNEPQLTHTSTLTVDCPLKNKGEKIGQPPYGILFPLLQYRLSSLGPFDSLFPSNSFPYSFLFFPLIHFQFSHAQLFSSHSLRTVVSY